MGADSASALKLELEQLPQKHTSQHQADAGRWSFDAILRMPITFQVTKEDYYDDDKKPDETAVFYNSGYRFSIDW